MFSLLRARIVARLRSRGKRASRPAVRQLPYRLTLEPLEDRLVMDGSLMTPPPPPPPPPPSPSPNGPVAVSTTLAYQCFTSTPLNVLQYDSDPNPGNTLNPSSINIVTPPQNGTAQVDPTTGLILYTPIPGGVIMDSFQYTVSDTPLGLTSNVATITLQGVAPTKGGFVVADDIFVSTATLQPLSINVFSAVQVNDGSAIDPTSVQILGATHSGPTVFPIPDGPPLNPVSVNPVTGIVTYTPSFGYVGWEQLVYSVKSTAGHEGRASLFVQVSPSVPRLEPDPLGGTMLVVDGTPGNDAINIAAGPHPGDVLVTVNGVTSGPFDPTSRIVAFGYAGNDQITVAPDVTIPAWINGRETVAVGNNLVVVTPSGSASTNITVLGPNGNVLSSIGIATNPAQVIPLPNNRFGVLGATGSGSFLELFQANGYPFLAPAQPAPPPGPPAPLVPVVIITPTPAQVVVGQNSFAVVQAASVAIYDRNGNLTTTLPTTNAATVLVDQDNFLVVQPGSVTVIDGDGDTRATIATTAQPSVTIGQNGFALVTSGAVALYDKDGHAHGAPIAVTGQATIIADQDNYLIEQAGSVTVLGNDGHLKTTITTTGMPQVVSGQNGFALETPGLIAIYDKDGRARGTPITTTAQTTVMADQDRYLIITASGVTLIANDGRVRAAIATASPPMVVPGQNGFTVIASGLATIYDKDGHAEASAVAVPPSTQVLAVGDRFVFIEPLANGHVQLAIYDSEGNLHGTGVV